MNGSGDSRGQGSRDPRRRAAAVALACVAVAAAPPVALGQRSSTVERVRAEVGRAEAGGLRTAVCVRDVDRGTIVYQHRADVAQLPASNQKLVTAHAFLSALGADYRFRTGFRVEGGTLRVRAGGDPNWITDGPVDPSATFAAIAEQLRGAGLRAVRAIEIERGVFTGPIRPADWPAGQRLQVHCAPTAGCVLDQGCWVAEVSPGSRDAVVRILAPPAALRLTGRIAMTADLGLGGKFHLEVRGDEFAVRGHFLKGSQGREVSGAVDDPEGLYLRSLRLALEAAGIAVDPGAEDLDIELEDVESPLVPVLERALTHSRNFAAEQLLRVLGAETRGDGSFDGGLAALEEVVTDAVGPLPAGVEFGDGSGMSRRNRATAAFLCDLLVRAARGPQAEVFVAALARPGREGTLLKRFRKSPLTDRVRAKTGTLAGVTTLSGYLQTGDGRLLAFSILMERGRSRATVDGREAQERILAALDSGRSTG